jgi:hypothetical protein
MATYELRISPSRSLEEGKTLRWDLVELPKMPDPYGDDIVRISTGYAGSVAGARVQAQKLIEILRDEENYKTFMYPEGSA